MTIEEKDQIFAEIEQTDRAIFNLKMKDTWTGGDWDYYHRLMAKKSRLERM